MLLGSAFEFTDPEYLDLLEEKILKNPRNFTFTCFEVLFGTGINCDFIFADSYVDVPNSY